MKKKIITIVLFTLTFIIVNAQIEKPSKVKIPKNKQFKSKVLEQSIEAKYVIETDLYATHKNIELSALNKKSKVSFNKMKAGNKRGEMQLKELALEKKHTEDQIKLANNITEKIRKVFLKIGPLPPCPTSECNNDWLKGLIFPNSIKPRAWVYDMDNNLIGILNNKPSRIDKKNQLKIYDIKWTQKYSGPYILKITRMGKNNLSETYLTQSPK